MPPGEFPAQSLTYRALMTHGVDDEELGVIREYIPSYYTWSPLTSFPLAMKRPPSQESTLTDTSLPDSLFSKLSEASEAESHITEPPRTSADVPARASCSKGESTDALPDIFFSPALDRIRELKHPLAPLLRPGDHQRSPPPSYPGSYFSILYAQLGGRRSATPPPRQLKSLPEQEICRVQRQQPNNARRCGTCSTGAAPV